jgi:hypothetical protein
MKKHILACIFCTIATIGFAQKKIKYETVFFKDKTVDGTNVRVNVENAVCENDFTEAKAKINIEIR